MQWFQKVLYYIPHSIMACGLVLFGYNNFYYIPKQILWSLEHRPGFFSLAQKIDGTDMDLFLWVYALQTICYLFVLCYLAKKLWKTDTKTSEKYTILLIGALLALLHICYPAFLCCVFSTYQA